MALKTPILIAIVAWAIAGIVLISDFVLYEMDNSAIESNVGDPIEDPNPVSIVTDPPAPLAPTIAPTNRLVFLNAEYQNSVHNTDEFKFFMKKTIAAALGTLQFRVEILGISSGSIVVEFSVDSSAMNQETVRGKFEELIERVQIDISESNDYSSIDTTLFQLETFDDTGSGNVNTVQTNTASPTSAPPSSPSPTTGSPTKTPTDSPTTASPTPNPTSLRETIVFPQVGGEEILTPNIVLIMADDMGWGDLSANYDNYPSSSRDGDWTAVKKGEQLNTESCGTGSEWTIGGSAGQAYPIYQTTNIDGLANTGILFNNFHAGNPVCTPTRASILSGRLPGRDLIDYVDNTGKNQVQEANNKESDKSESDYCLPQGTWTTATAAKEKGYSTAFFGKWHLGNLHNSKRDNKYTKTPIDFGFDRYVATTTNAATHDVTIHAACKEQMEYVGARGLGHYRYGNHKQTSGIYPPRWTQSVDNVIVKRNRGEPFNDNDNIDNSIDTVSVTNGCNYPNTLGEQTTYDHTRCDSIYEPFSFTTFADNDNKKDSCPGNTADNNIVNIDPSALGNSAKYLTTQALQFIDDTADGGKVPFFIEIATWHMHTPFTGSDDEKCQGSGIACSGGADGNVVPIDIFKNYKGSLFELDEAVGHLRDGLQARGMLEDTIILFTSDNGQEKKGVSGGSPGPYSGCKRENEEGGHRVPAVLSWPRVMTNMYHSSRPSNTMDILPTMESIFSTLPKDNTFNTTLYDNNGGFFRNRAGADGESFYDLLVTASENTVDSTILQTDSNNLRNSYMRIAGFEGNAGLDSSTDWPEIYGRWSIYSKNGQYKYLSQTDSDSDALYDLQGVGKTEITEHNDAGIKAELKSEYVSRKAEYDSDRSTARSKRGGTKEWTEEWNLCFKQT